MRQEMMGFWDAVASGGPSANNLHLAPDSWLITTPYLIAQLFTGQMLFLMPNERVKALNGEGTRHRVCLVINCFPESRYL